MAEPAARIVARPSASRRKQTGKGFFTKAEQDSNDIVACSQSGYIERSLRCCRRTHFFGTIFGSGRIFFYSRSRSLRGGEDFTASSLRSSRLPSSGHLISLPFMLRI